MTNLGIYLIKASLSMTLLYCVYWFFLRRETLFKTNRLYLISALLLSMLIPMITLHYRSSIPSDNSTDLILGSLLMEKGRANTSFSNNILSIISIIYMIGVAIFMFRILWQFILLTSIILKSKSSWNDGTRVIENEKFLLPFSFMKMIFINPKYIRDNEISDIIAHEKVHIRENHWLDLFIVELTTVFMWFNPFIWFYERSIKQNHEYLADEGVIAQGYSVGRYHSVLINQLMGMEVIGITNNLNYSLNAKRLKMMKQKKTPKTRALHILWSLPVVVLLLAAFAQPEYEKNDNNINPGTLVKTVKLTCGVYDASGDPIPGANVILKGKKVGTSTDKDGVFTLELDNTDIVIIKAIGFNDKAIYMEKIVAKEGKSDGYSLKVKMEASVKKEMIKGDANSELKDLEIMLKKLSIKKADLDKMKKKISQAEKEGTVDKDELDKKKASLKKEYMAVTEKMARVESKIKSLKKN
jgi:beta-lactamase regulating signal transducer with metallopeptidase domain